MAAAEIEDEEVMAAINVTPLVDIFLVLLIIFMIASSLLDHKEIPLNLPKAAAAGSDAPKASGLALDRDRTLYLDGVAMDSLEVSRRLREAAVRDSAHQVLISADEELPYRDVVGVIDMIRTAGVAKYALKVVRPQ
jgi:biopolymer transport protein ExbD